MKLAPIGDASRSGADPRLLQPLLADVDADDVRRTALGHRHRFDAGTATSPDVPVRHFGPNLRSQQNLELAAVRVCRRLTVKRPVFLRLAIDLSTEAPIEAVFRVMARRPCKSLAFSPLPGSRPEIATIPGRLHPNRTSGGIN